MEGRSCVTWLSNVRKRKTERPGENQGTAPLGVYEAEWVVNFVGHAAGVRRFQDRSTCWLVDRRGEQTRLWRDVSAMP